MNRSTSEVMHVGVKLPAEGIDWECAASPDALNPAHRVGDVCHAQEATGAVRGRRPRSSFSHTRSPAVRGTAGRRRSRSWRSARTRLATSMTGSDPRVAAKPSATVAGRGGFKDHARVGVPVSRALRFRQAVAVVQRRCGSGALTPAALRADRSPEDDWMDGDCRSVNIR